MRAQCQCGCKPEFAVTKDNDSVHWLNMKLFIDFKRSRKRFDKNSLFIAYVFRNFKKYIHGHCEIFGEAAIFAPDAKSMAIRAMTVIFHRAPRAIRVVTAVADFRDNAFTDKRLVVGINFFNNSDSLVTENSFVAHIAFCDFIIGIANPCKCHANKGFTFLRHGFCIIFIQL